MLTHPECKPGEKFLGNTLGPIAPFLAEIPGLRLGVIAYDIVGERLDTDHRPLIADASAAATYDRVMSARLSIIARGVKC